MGRNLFFHIFEMLDDWLFLCRSMPFWTFSIPQSPFFDKCLSNFFKFYHFLPLVGCLDFRKCVFRDTSCWGLNLWSKVSSHGTWTQDHLKIRHSWIHLSLHRGKIFKRKKCGTAWNGWCPPSHVFRSMSYPWPTPRVYGSLTPSRPLWRKQGYYVL